MSKSVGKIDLTRNMFNSEFRKTKVELMLF
jgi:hypothetical protein